MGRTVLLGLDGATFTLLDPLMAEGVMPCLRRVVEGGVRAELLSTANPVTPVAWSTLMTGRSPGNHGIFDFVRFEHRGAGGYFTVTSGRDLRAETIWSLASRQGCTVTALNFYGTFPAQPVAGHVVSGFVPWRHLRRAVYPPELYDRLWALPGMDSRELAMDLELEKKCIQGLGPDEYAGWLDLHLRRERHWFQVLRHLMRTEPSDLTAIVFDGVDKLQHVFWRYLDPALFPAGAPAADRAVRERCLDYFRQLDGFVEQVLELAGPDARLFLASDHGFGPTWEIFYVNAWLHGRGHLAWAEESAPDRDGKLTADRLKNHAALVDWGRTRAYALTPSSNGICIRVEREPGDGGVPPAEYETFREGLRRELLAYTDPATGTPVVTRVQTREEAFPGSQVHLAPDLLLTLRDGGFVSILNADEPLRPRAAVAGTHRPEGIFVAHGAGIRAGAVLSPLHIVDVAPTLLHSMGLPVPEEMEGSVADGAFEPGFTAPRSAGVGADGGERAWEPVAAGVPDDGADADGEAEILERLRALGYLE